MFKQIVQEDFPKADFLKRARKKSNKKLLFKSAMYLTFFQLKFSKKKWCWSKLFQVLIKFISKAFPKNPVLHPKWNSCQKIHGFKYFRKKAPS